MVLIHFSFNSAIITSEAGLDAVTGAGSIESSSKFRPSARKLCTASGKIISGKGGSSLTVLAMRLAFVGAAAGVSPDHHGDS